MATTPALDKPYKPTNTELKAAKSQNMGKLPMPKARPLPGRGNKNG